MHRLPVKSVSAFQRWAAFVSSDSRPIDLGKLEPVAEARHTFTLTNTTDSAIESLVVHTSFGCELAAVRVGEEIGPRNSLPIFYALSNRGGERFVCQW